jgi:hypothetical protein
VAPAPKFEEFSREKARSSAEEPMFTLQARGLLSLNNAAYRALGQPGHVALLYDTDQRIVGVRSVGKDWPNAYRVRPQGSSYIIGAQGFISYYGIKPLVAQRFVGHDYGESIWGFALAEGQAVVNRRGAREHPFAYTDRWRMTSDGFEVPALMRLGDYAAPPPALQMQTTEGSLALMRVGALIACEPLGVAPPTSELAQAFLLFLEGPYVMNAVKSVTSVSAQATWTRWAGHGRINLEAGLVDSASAEAPVAWARLLLPETSMSSYGRDPRFAELIIHIEPRGTGGRAVEPAGISMWHERFIHALSIPEGLHSFLSRNLNLKTTDDPAAHLGIMLKTKNNMADFVDLRDLQTLEGSQPSPWYMGWTVADPKGQPPAQVAIDLLRSMCDYTLHVDGYEAVLAELGQDRRADQMARVEWSRLSGDDVEAVLGVLLCREHPAAMRVKPSKGDGGIDVWIPEGDTAVVYQIKGYTGNIGATRKRHIESSWNRLLAYAKENFITLSGWYLVTPENPTKEQISWFRQLTSDVTFPCGWRGLDFVDGLAAKYPEIIDYYLRDGKDRLEETVQRLLSVAGLSSPPDTPSSSIDSLRELHETLNQFDPHFYYDFSVQMLNADGTCPPAPLATGTMVTVQLSNSERCVTYNITPRFNEALKERPVPGSMTFSAEPGSMLHEQIEDWTKFGTPLTNVQAKDVHWDLPGGFSASYDQANVSVGPSKPEAGALHEQVTLRVSEPDGKVLTSLDFLTEEATSGLDRQGVRYAGHDKEAGLVRYEIRMRRDDAAAAGQVAANINISAEDPTGRAPGDMLPGLRFIAALRPPRRIQLFSRNGPALIPPLPIPEEMIPEAQEKLWITICESLSTIQQHVIERIKFPDMTRYQPAEAMDVIEQWYLAARLLRGEGISGRWHNVGLHLHPGQQPPSGVQQGFFFFNKGYSTQVGDKTYELGIVTMQVASIQVDATSPPMVHDDHIDVRLIPGGDDTMMLRMPSATAAIGDPEPLRSFS